MAAGVSPLIMPLLVYMTFHFVFGGDVEKNQDMQTSISTATWVSFFLAVVFGGASYYWMRRKSWWSVWHYLMMGSVAGVASWIFFSIISQTFVSLLFYIFIVAGVLMGIGFWLIAYFQPDGNHLISASTSSRRKRRRG